MKIKPFLILNVLFPLILFSLLIFIFVFSPYEFNRLWNMTSDAHYEEKRMEDPVYRFIKQVKEHVSTEDSVYFYEKWVYGHKARYYLYPVRYIFMPPRLSNSEVLERINNSAADFVICNSENKISESQDWKFIFEAENWRLYRINKKEDEKTL